MGVVKRQSLKKSLVRYIGVIIGMTNLLLIYPLSGEMLGEIRFVVNTASLLVPFFLLGINSWTVRFFTTFRNPENGHNGFLGLLLLTFLIGFSLLGGVVYFFQDQLVKGIASFLSKTPEELIENGLLILGLTLLLGLAKILTQYISNFNRIVIPDILSNFSLKIIYPVLILLFYYMLLSRTGVKNVVLVSHLVIAIGLFVYVRSLGQLKLKINFSFLDRPLMKSMGTYALFGIIGMIGSVFATRIDYFMVTTLSEESYFGTWTYDFAVQIINVVIIPYTAFVSIGTPIIARAMADKNNTQVVSTYKRSSIVLMVAGLGLFLATWVSVDQLFLLTSRLEEVKGAKYVIFFLGLGRIVDMMTGLNTQIIAFSKYFRFNVIAVVFLGVLNIFTNLYFIPRFGITGAAIATCISLALFNIMKLLFVWIKLDMQPFTWATLKVAVFAAFAFGVAYLLPYSQIPLLDIAIHSGVFTVLFATLVLYFKVSEDLNDFYTQVLKRVRKLMP